MKKVIVLLVLLCVMSFAQQKDSFIDSRDKQKYHTVKIGTQTWMAQNLNYKPKTGNSWCYQNNVVYCDKYGRLYDWQTAKTVCPNGWHLPNDKEWTVLTDYTGGDSVAGKYLKTTSGWWDSSSNGTDGFGFRALPGGCRGCHDDVFNYADEWGTWWSSTEIAKYGARYLQIESLSEYAYMGDYDKEGGVSVRCIKD